MLEFPQFTRPAEYRGLAVPDVLKSGNHADVERWRSEQALARTRARRPDLVADLDSDPPSDENGRGNSGAASG